MDRLQRARKTKNLIPQDTDTVDYRRLVVSALFLRVRIAHASNEPVDEVLNIVEQTNGWLTWARHLARKDQAEARPHFESMFRQLYNCSLKVLSTASSLLWCHSLALECVMALGNRSSFYETGCRFSRAYEKLCGNILFLFSYGFLFLNYSMQPMILRRR
jgi:hypothetical protein